MDFVVAVKTNSESAKVVEPAECSLRDHSKNAKAASMFLIPFGEVWFDSSFAKFLSARLGVIRSISIAVFCRRLSSFNPAMFKISPFEIDQKIS